MKKKFGTDIIDDLLFELKEEKSQIKKIIGVYGGRFQPFGPHHYKTYKWLERQFDTAYITTSNIKKPPKHPMNFSEKVRHMVKMGVPSSKIVMERIPFVAKSLLSKFDPKTTAVVYIFGAKDKGRLSGGKYFQDYKKNKNNLKGHEEHGYVLVAPHVSVSAGGMEVSGTSMRELLGSPKIDDSEREKLFKKMFGYFDKGIYQMMTNKFKKLYEGVINGAPDPKDVKKMRKKLDRNDKERKYSGNKKYQYEPTNEDIHIPVKVGDTVVMGRFKNKKVKVKSIGVNEKGDVIINGRSAMKFRIYQRGDSEVTGIEHYADSIKVTNEEIFNFLLKYDIEEILNESSTGNSGQAPPDSGPGAYFKSFPAYKIDSIVGAQKLGMKVVKYILSGGKDDEDDYPIYGEDNIAPVPAVSWFPAGVSGKHTANNQIDLIGTEAWDAWIDHMKPLATSIGYKLIDELQYGDWDEEELKDTSTVGSKETLKVMNKEQPPDTKIKGKKQKPKSIEEVIDISNLIKELAVKQFNRYKNIRKYTDPELQEELGEFFENEDTHRIMPDLAQDEEQLREIFKNAKLYYLSNKSIFNLENSDAASVIEGIEAKELYDLLDSYEKDWETVKLGFATQEYFPPPIVVRDSNKALWLLGGNTRLCIGLLIGQLLPVKIVEYNRSFILNGMSESLIMEGGAYGHMAHPFDDKNLTFTDLKKIITMGLGGTLNREDGVTEKLDGQNIMISWRDGKLIAARNKGHLKNGGKSALDAKGISGKFAGRGNIANAFNFAMKDLGKAIGSLSEKQRVKIFDNGHNFMNMEVMWPKSANVIDYDVATLVFHGALKYNDAGNVIGQVGGSASMLAGMIKQVNQHIQSKYSIGKPNFLSVPKHQDFSKMKDIFLGRLSKLQSQYGLKDGDTLALYHQSYWEEYIYNASQQFGYKIPNKILKNLTKRWAFFDKSYKIPTIKKDLKKQPKFLEWVLNTDKNDHTKMVKENMKPFEVLFFQVGAEIMKNISGFIAANPNNAVQGIKKRLDAAISNVRSGGDLKKLNKLKAQLEKLNSIGGLDSIVPSEGIVFKYNGKTYKFTGAFAPINQITGLIAF